MFLMDKVSRAAAFPVLLALGAPGQAVGGAREQADWRATITAEDRRRLGRGREAWITALDRARASDAAAVRAAGVLFDPDRALPTPVPPAGRYRCRTFKLGAQTPGMLDYVAYPPFACRVWQEGGRVRLAKLTGSQRPVGIIYAAGGRAIFLGTLVLGDEAGAIRYGRDRLRDMVGVVERVEERRWRVAFPQPAFESLLDVMELVPA